MENTISAIFNLVETAPAMPVLITASTLNFSISNVAVTAAQTLPIPERDKTISLLLSLPIKNSCTPIVSVFLSVISEESLATSSSIAPIIPNFMILSKILSFL